MNKLCSGVCMAVLALAATSCQHFQADLFRSLVAGAVTTQFTEDFEDDSGSGAGGFAASVFSHTVFTGIVAEADFPAVAPFPSPTHALRLAAGVDSVTFALNPGESVDHAGVWGNTNFGAAVVEFIGTNDTLTFTLTQGLTSWQFVEAASTDIGALGQPLGAITAVNLTGLEGLFDDLTIDVVGPPGVDLDIARLQTTRHFSLTRGKASIGIKLVVMNTGLIDEARDATVVGMQNAVEVYNQTMAVSDAPGNGRTTWEFPSFTPKVTGDIAWTATLADDDSDVDEATASTTVVD